MSWQGPIPGMWIAYAAMIAAALTIVAYIIKMRRRRFEVPFSSLWKRVLDQRDANALWKQLKRLLSLAFLLAIIGLVLVAALGPTLGGRDPAARSVVILFDASASMKAQDGDPDRAKVTRLDKAREKAKALVDSMGGGDLAMIMRVDGQATPLSRFEGDKPMLRKYLDHIVASDTPADLPRALSAAADALRGRQNPTIVIVSDGAYSEQQLGQASWTPLAGEAEAAAPPAPGKPPADEVAARRATFEHKQLASVDLSGIDVRYIGVGSRAENVGIVAFNVRRYIANKASYEVFIEVQNFGTKTAHRQLALYNGETAIEIKSIDLDAGQRIREIYRQLPGGESTLRASLRPGEGDNGTDPFPLDDQAWALLPARKRQNVLVVSAGNKYLDDAMKVYDNIAVDPITPAAYDADPAHVIISPETGKPYDVVVFDDHTPVVPPPPPINLIYFHPTGEHTPIAIAGTTARPRVTDVAADHPVMRWIELGDVNFDEADVFAPDRAKGEIALASYVRDPVIAAKRADGQKTVAFGFSLVGTDLVLRVAFPLLLVNSLDWFAGDDADLVTTYITGQRSHIPLDGLVGVREVTVIDPAGHQTQAPVVDGMATFYGQRVGIHQIVAYDPHDPAPIGKKTPIASFELAANLGSPTESRIAPTKDLVLAGKKLEPPPHFAVSARRDLWIYLVLGVIFLLGLEWVTYHRRITV